MMTIKRRNSIARKKPLTGLEVMITRSEEGNRSEESKLKALGAEVFKLPTVLIAPPSSWKSADRAIRNISSYDWIVFTSSNGVEAFFNRLEKLEGKKKLDSIRRRVSSGLLKFAAVGPATAKTLKLRGFRSHFTPEKFLTSELGMGLSRKFDLSGKKVMLARAQNANPQITSTLKNAGAVVDQTPFYRTLKRTHKLEKSQLDQITDITLTSPSTVEGMLRTISSKEITKRPIAVHCIGPVTAKKAKSRGLNVDSIAATHTIDGLIETLIKHARAKEVSP